MDSLKIQVAGPTLPHEVRILVCEAPVFKSPVGSEVQPDWRTPAPFCSFSERQASHGKGQPPCFRGTLTGGWYSHTHLQVRRQGPERLHVQWQGQGSKPALCWPASCVSALYDFVSDRRARQCYPSNNNGSQCVSAHYVLGSVLIMSFTQTAQEAGTVIMPIYRLGKLRLRLLAKAREQER